jgi:hypothetical protein
MRRNRRGPGASGSTGFLSRALRCAEGDLLAGFATIGLVLPAGENDEPVFVELGEDVWWLNKDQRGGIWINQRLKSDRREPEPGEAGQGEPNQPATVGTEPSQTEPIQSEEIRPEPTQSDTAPAADGAPAKTSSKLTRGRSRGPRSRKPKGDESERESASEAN